MRNRLHLFPSCRLFFAGAFFFYFSTLLQAQQDLVISIEGPEVICQFDCVTYFANITPPSSSQQVQYFWSVNGATSPVTFNGSSFTFCPAEWNIPIGQIYISVSAFIDNGQTLASDSIYVYIQPFQPLIIRSSNMAPCNTDSTFCEKVCPGVTVTYSIENSSPGGTGFLSWNVVGAESWVVNPNGGNPNSGNSVTVTWGPAGAGSVSVFSDGIFGCAGEAALCVNIIETPQAAFSSNPAAPASGNLTVCKNQTVYFDNESSGADRYEWSFSDDLSTSTEVNPEHTFLTPGIYTVSLIAFSDCLCSDTTSITLEVLDAESPMLDCVGTVCPGAAVTYTAANGCQPFTWTVSSNGTITGGGTATSDTISVLWNDGPIGTITLGSQPCAGMVCPIPATLEVPIISNNAEIQGRERVCPASTEVYSIEAFGGTSFVWSLGSGGTITGGQGTNRVTVEWGTFPNPAASHWLSVTYENCYLGCGGADSIEVHTLSAFALSGPVEACVGGSIPLVSKLIYNNQNLNSNWTLFDPAGNSVWTASNTASVLPSFENGAGMYRMLAVPTNPAQTCTDEAEWNVQVAPLPAEPGSIAGERNICPGSTYTYEALGLAPNLNVQWTLQNGAGAPTTFFGNPVNVTWAAAGPYQLAAASVSTNGLNCTSDTIQMNPAVIGIPAITGTAASCEDALGTYTIIPQNIDIQWSTTPAGAGAVAEGQGTNAVDIFWTQAGNHTVNVAVCGQTASFPVTVWANPDPIVQHPAGLCPGATGVVQTSVPFSSYSWKDEDGAVLSSAAMPVLQAGTFAVQVTDANGCSGKSEFSMASYDAPDVSLTTADPTGFCNNAGSVLLSALTDADANYTYQWFRDGGAIAGATAVEHTDNQYGLYTVQATNGYGCMSLAGPINIYNYCGGGGGYGPPGPPDCAPGTIEVTFDPNVRCDSFQFHILDNVGQYAAGSANWLFFISGGAALGTASGDNPSFVFNNAGKYKVFATVQLLDGSSCRALGSVEVETVARFDQVTDCPASNTIFEDVSEFLPAGGISSYAWDFGDPASGASNTDSGVNPQHNYAVSGIYQVQLTVTGTSGCTSSATVPVEIPALPDASFAAPAARCAGNALLFEPINMPGDLLDVVWGFGDPASGSADDATGISVYHNYATPNTYTVTATATNVYGCSATFSLPVIVSPNPLSGSISPANPTALCEGLTMTLTAPAGATSYLWSDENMTTTPTLVVSKAGVYSVTLTDANGCTFVPTPVTIHVTPAPDALIKALLLNELGQTVGTAYPSLSVCAGEDVQLQAQGNGVYNYLWSGGNGMLDEVFFTEDRGNLLPVGTHTFTVTVTNPANGCTSVTDPFVVTVNPNPDGFSISSSGFCGQTTNVLTYTGPEPANWQFVWSSGATGTSLSTDASGAFFIRVINEFGCEAKSNVVNILPGPQVTAIPSGCHERCGPDTLCIPNLPNITSWQWYLNGSPIPGATTPDLIATESGSYYAVLSDVSGCTAQSGPLNIQLGGGTGNVLGAVWSDVNNNGLVNYTADTTLGTGITVMLLQNGIPIDTTVADGNGVFQFNNLPSGWYVVMLDSTTFDPGWYGVIDKDSVYVSSCGEGFDPVDLLMRFECEPIMQEEQLLACAGGFALYDGTPVPAGTTQVFPSVNAFGCDVFTTVNVLPLPPSFNTIFLAACPGSTVSYEGVDLPVGAVQDFTFLNTFGCDSTVTVNVLPLENSFSSLALQACPGTSVSYEGVVLAIGTTQNFTLINASGCDSVVTVTVTAFPTTNSTLDVYVCPGENYEYNGLTMEIGQTVVFTFTNQWGCDSIITLSVKSYDVPNNALAVSVCPGATYEYGGENIPAGETREIHLTGANGCDSIILLSVTAFPEAFFEVLSTESCPNASDGSVEIADATGGTLPYEYAVDGNWQSGVLFENLAPGAHNVQLRDGSGCIFSEEAEIAELPEILFTLTNGVIPCDSTEITLSPTLVSGNAQDLDFSWSTGETTASIQVNQPGLYTFSARISGSDCAAVSSEVAVQWAAFTDDESFFYIPNVIKTEASDPENAAFRPRFPAGLNVAKYKLAVYDRWGTQVFFSENPSDSWMGTFKGSKLRPGVWIWTLEAEVSFCGRMIVVRKEGDVALIR